MDARMRLAFGKQPAQRREVCHAMNRMRGREKTGRAQISALHRIIAEMVIKPRPPGRVQRIARLEHRAQPPPGAAAHQPKMPAALLRHQFKNDARLAIAPHAKHDAFVSPLHGAYVACPAQIRRLCDALVLPPGAGGRGPRLRAVEGARAVKISYAPHAPSTMLRMVPLP